MDNPHLKGKTNLDGYIEYVGNHLPIMALMLEKRTLLLIQCRQYREIAGVPTLANNTIEVAAECASVFLALHTISPIQHLRTYMLPLLKDMVALSEDYMLISDLAIKKWWGSTLQDSIH